MSGIATQIAFLCQALENNPSRNLKWLSDQDTVLDTRYLTLLSGVLQHAITHHQRPVVLCTLAALRALFKAPVSRETARLLDSAIKRLKTVIWTLVAGQTDAVGGRVQREACTVLMAGFGLFYPLSHERSALIADLLSGVDDATGLRLLRDLLLGHLASTSSGDRQGNSSGESCR